MRYTAAVAFYDLACFMQLVQLTTILTMHYLYRIWYVIQRNHANRYLVYIMCVRIKEEVENQSAFFYITQFR